MIQKRLVPVGPKAEWIIRNYIFHVIQQQRPNRTEANRINGATYFSLITLPVVMSESLSICTFTKLGDVQHEHMENSLVVNWMNTAMKSVQITVNFLDVSKDFILL